VNSACSLISSVTAFRKIYVDFRLSEDICASGQAHLPHRPSQAYPYSLPYAENTVETPRVIVGQCPPSYSSQQRQASTMEQSRASFASNNPRAVASPTMIPDPKQALSELEQAIDLIPEAEKEAYLHAVRTVPALVQLESPALRYLRFDSYNTWAAARRLVDYWQGRVELFGLERAYLPLRLTPSPSPANATETSSSRIPSALDDLDVEVVNCGTYMVLPKDSAGRPVLLHDRSRYVTQTLRVGSFFGV
jgi:hypothetical protein